MFRNIPTTKLLACVLILSILFSFLPAPAHADVVDIGANAVKCTIINGTIRAITYVIAAIKISKAFSLFSSIPIIGSSIPKPTIDFGFIAKQALFDVYARCIARAILDSAIGGILNTIRTGGRDGGPSYIRNWRNFQTQAQYRGEAVFRSVLANTPVCSYLRDAIDAAYRVKPQSKLSLLGMNLRIGSLDPFTLRGRCTLPDGFDIAAYQKDFAANGGWDALTRLLEPQNNPYGLALLAADELSRQREAEIAADNAQALAGNGYLGSSGSNPCKVRGEDGKCIQYENIRSPGSLLSGSAIATIKSELDWFTDVHTLEDLIIGVITNRLIERLTALDVPEDTIQYNNDFPTPQPTNPPDICTIDPTDPSCSTPTPIPPPTTTPPTTTTCVSIAPGTPGPYDSAIQNAIVQISQESLTSVNPILNPNDTQGQYFIRINDLSGYFIRMEQILQSRGYSGYVSPTLPSQALRIYTSGSQTSEEYMIATTVPEYTRASWSATSCPTSSGGGGGGGGGVPPTF